MSSATQHTEVRPEDYVNSNSRPSDLKITDVRARSSNSAITDVKLVVFVALKWP